MYQGRRGGGCGNGNIKKKWTLFRPKSTKSAENLILQDFGLIDPFHCDHQDPLLTNHRLALNSVRMASWPTFHPFRLSKMEKP
jgi:hypothetical protein